ncbi:MAG: hypothetical protein AMJ53_06240 [Gammaproteobacteria bacterium SG8_11]|nr:MAG: hypothetical protein AMJ53_06240 [Gammaproteobacteria bacterium SG8_11]
MPAPFSPLFLLLFIIAITALIAFVQIGLVTIAFDKLGLSSSSALLLLISSLIGSVINLPLFSLKAEPPASSSTHPFFGLLRPPPMQFTGRTIITMNVGGGLIPLFFSAYLMNHHVIPPSDILIGIFIVTLVSYFISRPVQGIGIGMPILIAPLCAALVAVMLNSEASAPLAYISGTLGVLIGADILRLNNIRKMGLPFASIGGAGTFDGIFITGIVAVLLA